MREIRGMKGIFVLLIILVFPIYSKNIFKENRDGYKIKDIMSQAEKLRPVLKNSGSKYKIAVIQSDDYPEYYGVFTSIVEGMRLIGWIKENDITNDKKYSSNREFIKGIQGKDYSDFVEFSPEYFFSFLATDENVKKPAFKKLIEKCKSKEIDIVILLGTLASKQVFAQEGYNTPTVMDAVSDPIGSGLVKSADDSGNDILTARIDPESVIRQMRLFHDVIGFEKLGTIYENTENGRWYAAVDSVERVAEERGVDLIVSNNAMAEPTLEQYQQAFDMYLNSMDKICPQVDAMFLGISGGLESANLPNVVNKLIEFKLPSFAMEGEAVVSKGAMLGVSGKEAGIYNAKKIAEILKGKKPRELDQHFEKIPKISINLKTAELIGYDMPVDIIRSADEIFTEIEGE